MIFLLFFVIIDDFVIIDELVKSPDNA